MASSTSETADTLAGLLGQADPTSPALLAPDRPPLDHRGLAAQIAATVDRLNALGIGRGDKVAIVLPNGPEMASAFLSIAAGAVTAPLNPAYRAEEFAFYLDDLQARALVVLKDWETPARAVAAEKKVPVLELSFDPADPAGSFTLDGPAGGECARPGRAGPDDIALVLHTSGTTSRPKIVPLRQRNLVASARHIGATLALTPADRCLNIMPLFHIHGLIAATLSSLAAGGSVYCTPGFNALRFFTWLEEAGANWYSAVPTMHQAILSRAERNQAAIKAHPLRFIRSSSSSLPPQVMAALEDAFGAPVIESYGMTEATHQMTSNPLPPKARKPGSVGIAAGPEVAIMDADGAILPQGATGEVVIRGPNVTAGYENNPEANRTAFTNGWFRTGDQGVFDAEGYLTITGRLKEIINRGGEKISPREVDEVLMDHPAVAQAIAFAIPHDKLGEDVGAAVVLRDGATVEEAVLRRFVGERLADFKVPRRILFLDEIPKGATGKLQRIGLAAKLGLGA
ncbi:acyl--CoA ligase [Oceanibacterium hippocampi]|uniref:Putative sulfoacetate--CoA ligase n=1 Tax=Oceanibacterium hippocampi TaxID=745714 RepID=A0A1Y5RUP4_9PROT|nr:acyl--CoA ligase [Oceanibacterium hippocampi]SLN25931.1 putative sulfoacetate--CoA ligase [Oceanibacterium hippocampi]